jgi:hypothetical protein
MTLKTPTEEYRAETIDVSAGGVLFHTEAAIEVNSIIRFTIGIPREALGTECGVHVNCRGRVVRRFGNSSSGWNVAAVIDEYEFDRVADVQ